MSVPAGHTATIPRKAPSAQHAGRAKSLGKANKTPTKTPSALVVPKHGNGRIYQGRPANPAAGPGRPRDEVRALYRELGATKGLAVVDKALTGAIRVSFVGECPECKHVGPLPDGHALQSIVDQIGSTVDQQLKANEQALKYGLGTKDETTVVNSEEAQRFAAAYRDALYRNVAPKVAERILTEITEALQHG